MWCYPLSDYFPACRFEGKEQSYQGLALKRNAGFAEVSPNPRHNLFVYPHVMI
jgi:hypothetical protein